MSRLRTLARRALFDREEWVFYRHAPMPGRGVADPEALVYRRVAEVPSALRPVLFPDGALSTMALRMRRGRAWVVCFGDERRGCVAYGWVQDWASFRRRYAMVADEGVVFGPFWTDPALRGRGLMGRLIGHALRLVDDGRPAFAAIAPDNVASQRGFRAAGFARVARYRTTIVCQRWISWSLVDEG